MFFKVLSSPIQFLYFSSDHVFHDASPSTPPFLEEQTPNPVNYYGQTKAQAEAMLMAHQRFTHVFRLGTLFGEPMGFATRPRYTWVDWLKDRIARGQNAPLFSNQIRSHLYVGDLVRAVRKFLAKAPAASKLYNIAGASAHTRLDFGLKLARALDLDESLIKAALSESERRRAPRPLNAGLSSKRFERDFEFNFQSADDAIHEYAERLRTGFTRNWS
jgi:dTDP-4-dehydrorhamnose reductase